MKKFLKGTAIVLGGISLVATAVAATAFASAVVIATKKLKDEYECDNDSLDDTDSNIFFNKEDTNLNA